MKMLTRSLGLFILSILVVNTCLAQKASFSTRGGITIGLGAGLSYQKSDLANSNGLGFDFILGSQLYKKENAFLSVDWKFRFLAGENKAFDHRINTDNTYSNIRYSFFNYDLELGLTLNRLRERTRIVLTGFAGAGITHGRTFTDLYDAGNNLYLYSGIDPNRDSKLVYKDLLNLSDGDFETHLLSKVALLPTVGLFMGYQLSRSLTVGFEFKTNFYLTEQNSLVSINLDNRAISGSGLDRNSYISLGFRWNFGGGSNDHTQSHQQDRIQPYPNPNTTRTNTQSIPVSSPSPTVHITDPPADTYHTASYNHTLRATVHHVSGPENISFYQDGFPNNRFTYNRTTNIFTANISLREGENNIRIKAANQTATAEDVVIISCENPREAVKPAPLVGFTSPSRNQNFSTSNRINVTASVKNISSKQHIQLTLNGNSIPFEFYPLSRMVKSGIVLNDGINNLIINGLNESGSAQDQLTVYFNRAEETPIPTVRFINPAFSVKVQNRRFPLSAETHNVHRQDDVRMKLNGTQIGNFSFSTNGEISVNLLLSEGVNNIEITVENEAGLASERTSITYYEPEVRTYPPEIEIISPQTLQYRTDETFEELHAAVLNVNTKEDITLTINGYNTRNFSFSPSTKVLTTRVSLQDGRTVLTINARNESGVASKDQVFIKETRTCPQPIIRLIAPAQEQINTKQQNYAFRAEVRHITSSNQLRLTVNGKTVPFSLNNNLVSSALPLAIGLNTLSLSARNDCGENMISSTIRYTPSEETKPCTPPTISFNLQEVNRTDATHELRGEIFGTMTKAGISITLDGKAHRGFQFIPPTGELSAKFKLPPGSHTIVVSASNACGTDSESTTVLPQPPCTPPTLSFNLQEVNRTDATHELRGAISGTMTKAGISITLDGKAHRGFQFLPPTGELSAKFKLPPGSHTIVVSASNACGTDSESETLTIEEEACGPRINPGKSAWQFCLVTPSGTFSRDNLTNSNFSYSGPATSLYFMPIGGGGDATVKGRSYPIKSGQYYLFTGKLNVTVSTKNPGSMGHWSVCISADSEPVSGNGNNRPTSPCEETTDTDSKGKGNR
jgi:large repetitive protein